MIKGFIISRTTERGLIFKASLEKYHLYGNLLWTLGFTYGKATKTIAFRFVSLKE